MTQNNEKNKEDIILQKAEDLFLEKGLAMVSTTDIAKAVGCNQALIHYYFRTKENLFQQIFMRKFQLFISAFSNIESSEIDFFSKLKYAIEAHFDILIQNQKLPFLIINEVITNPKRLDFIKERFFELTSSSDFFIIFSQELEAEIEKGNIRKITPFNLFFSAVCLNITSIIAAPIYQHIFNLNEEDKMEFLQNRKKEIVKLIINGIKK